MVKISKIQQAIQRLNGGEYQELMNAYLYKKYKFKNITTLGSKAGTSKTTKGTPDTYVENENGKYTLIMYGTVANESFTKIKKDIQDAYNIDKTHIEEDKIETVICCYTSNNIGINQREELKSIIKGKNVILIGIDDLAFDLANNFQGIANTYLDVALDSGQICDIDEFIKRYDKSSINAPLDLAFIDRVEKEKIVHILAKEQVIILLGKPGVGKTRLALEVCREYTKVHNNIKCLCIRNNGNDIYEDLNDYIENGKEYLIFIDDANEMKQLQTFMDFVKLNDENTKIKVILTVRDYALESVVFKLNEYIEPKLYRIEKLNDSQLIEIIEKEYYIIDKNYQKQILKIAKGNPRIAILAAKAISEKKIDNLKNVIDIFRSYYVPIIGQKSLNELDIKTLFIIALLGPFKIVEDKEIYKIINKLGLEKEKFLEIINKLNRMEMVDVFENKAVKISDQNFGNYIEYKFIIEDKTILFSDLIRILGKKYLIDIANVTSMITSIFGNDQTEQYLTDEIKTVWDEEPYDKDAEFLFHFYQSNMLKALKILSEEIKFEKEYVRKLTKYDFMPKLPSRGITDRKIEILSAFKYTDLKVEALELIIQYFIKDSYTARDIYYCLAFNMGIDEKSEENNYEFEKMIIDKFMEKIELEEENKCNLSLMLIKIIKKFLDCKYHFAESNYKRLIYGLSRTQLKVSQGLIELRHKMFNALVQLYKISELKEDIDDVLYSYKLYDYRYRKNDIFEDDLSYLSNHLFCDWKSPDYMQCEILKRFKTNAQNTKLENIECLNFYKNNKNFLIFSQLEDFSQYENDFCLDKINDNEKIDDLIKNYKTIDYSILFEICKDVEHEQKKCKKWDLRDSIFYIINNVLLNQKSRFPDIFRQYIKYKTPFCSEINTITRKMIHEIGQERVLQLLNEEEINPPFEYLNEYYSIIIPKEEKEVDNIIALLKKQLCYIKIHTINIRDLLKYEKIRKRNN